ncbi:hypothetical protein D3C80_1771980 [compost metagenome]
MLGNVYHDIGPKRQQLLYQGEYLPLPWLRIHQESPAMRAINDNRTLLLQKKQRPQENSRERSVDVDNIRINLLYCPMNQFHRLEKIFRLPPIRIHEQPLRLNEK